MLVRNRRSRVVMKRPRLYVMLAASLAVPAVAAAIMAVPAVAAAPTPVSLTNCGGTLAPDPSGAANGEPNLLDYTIPVRHRHHGLHDHRRSAVVRRREP